MLWTLLLVLPLALCQDSPCPTSSTCTVFSSCPWYLEFKNLKRTNRTEYRKRLKTVKKSICNKAEKKVCCVKLGDDDTIEDKDSGTIEKDNYFSTKPLVTINNTSTSGSSPDPTKNSSQDAINNSFTILSSESSPGATSNSSLGVTSHSSPSANNHLLLGATNHSSSDATNHSSTVAIDIFSPGWIPLSSNGECGEDDSSFIVGGENTRLGEMPWTALLGAVGNRNGKFQWKCGGTLINKWFVLTAAHCNPVTLVRLGEWRVVAMARPNKRRAIVFSEAQRIECGTTCWNYALVDGTRDCTIGGTIFRHAREGTSAHCGGSYQEFKVIKIVVHPEYRILGSGVVINDIALIKLSRPAMLISEGDFLVSPICLPLPGDELKENEVGEGTVIGWGKTYLNDGVLSTVKSPRQKKLKMPLINNEECANVLSRLFKMNLLKDITQQHHLCAGGVKGKDSCNGDSGGPFIVRNNSNSPYILAGVVSFGSARCGIGTPAVFTQVKTYVQWIKENLV